MAGISAIWAGCLYEAILNLSNKHYDNSRLSFICILPNRRYGICDVVRNMGIYINCISCGSETVVHIAGRLSSTTVAQLKEACEPIAYPFVIDLSNLLFADDEGIIAIREIIDKGARVRGASPFVQLLLDNTPG